MKTAFRENLRIGVANCLVDGLGHHRTTIDLLEVAYRHLAWTEAVETDFVLEVYEARVRFGIEIERNADLEFMFQSVGVVVSFTCMASIFFRLVRQEDRTFTNVGARLSRQRRWFGGPGPRGKTRSDGRSVSNRHAQTRLGLVRAEGLEPPRLSSLEPKSSASTSSATPAGIASYPAAMPRARAYSMRTSVRSKKKACCSSHLVASAAAGHI